MKKIKLFFTLLLIVYQINVFSQSAYELCKSGWDKVKNKDYDAAFQDFTKAIETDEAFTDAYFGRAKCYISFEQFEMAVADLSFVIDGGSELPEAYLLRGVAYGRMKKKNEAFSNFDKAIGLDPNNDEAYTQRAFFLRSIKDPDGAMNDFNKAIALKSDNANVYYNRADLFYKEYKRTDKAIEDLNKAIELNPGFQEAYYRRGLCYKSMKNYIKAAESFSESIDNGNKDTTALFKRADSYFLAGEYDNAIVDYSKLMKVFKLRDDIIYLKRGYAYNRAGLFNLAAKDLSRALMFYRDNADAYVERAYANTKLNLISTAMKDFKNAEILAPKYQKTYLVKGDMYLQTNKPGLALECYDKAVDLKKTDEAFFKRAACKESMKNKKGACEDYKAAADLGNKDALEKLKSFCR